MKTTINIFFTIGLICGLIVFGLWLFKKEPQYTPANPPKSPAGVPQLPTITKPARPPHRS